MKTYTCEISVQGFWEWASALVSRAFSVSSHGAFSSGSTRGYLIKLSRYFTTPSERKVVSFLHLRIRFLSDILILKSSENRISSGGGDSWARLSLESKKKNDNQSAEGAFLTLDQTHPYVLDDEVIHDDCETAGSDAKPFVGQIKLEAKARRPRSISISQRQDLEHQIRVWTAGRLAIMNLRALS